MTNINNDELGEAMLRSVHADYLIKYIEEPLEEVASSLQEENKMFRGGFIGIVLLLIFTHIDLLGYLYTGDTSIGRLSKNAVKFLREYLGRVDSCYKEVGGLLYDSLRHGYVHLFTPKRIQLKNGMIVDFSFATGGQRQDYLTVKKTEELQMSGQRVEIYRLLLYVSLLYEDLLSAIDKYAEDIRHNQALSDVFEPAFETRRNPQKEEDLLKKQHVQSSDFNFVRKQILNP